MKIGIITFWYGNDNYGMMLQCWALQQVLKKMGHDPFLIRYIPTYSTSKKTFLLKLLTIYSIYKFIKRKIEKRKTEKIEQELELKNRQRDFSGFRTVNLKMSDDIYHTLKEIRQSPPIADCYITGSDQVWAQLLNNENNKVFFLDFGPQTIHRIAYAPSFSMKVYPLDLRPNLRQSLSKIDYISVREYDGVKICESCGFKANKVLDPTLLLDKSDYTALSHDNSKDIYPYVFIYSLNISNPEDIRWAELELYQKTHKLHTIVTPASGYNLGLELFGNQVEYSYATIQEWLKHIINAQFVITSSFHGIVFSILLNKDFIYVPLKGKNGKGNNRIYDLLKDLNLENRILCDNKTYEYILNTTINWTEIQFKLDKLRQGSFLFLAEALKQ